MREANIRGMTKRRKEIRLKAIEHLGGKCDLLCANCHRELHVEQKLAASRENSGMKSE